MKNSLVLLALLLSALILGGMFHSGKKPSAAGAAKEKACLKAAKSPCKATVQKTCKGKSGFAKTACEKATLESCMAAAKKACKKK